MDQPNIITAVAEEIRRRLDGEGSGHDWWHVYRVWQVAKRIGQEERADMFVVELAALLHDVADWKFHDGDDTVGPRVAREIMESHSVPVHIIDHACKIIPLMSYKGAGVATPMPTLEGKVVQDADRLDALGAIGIGRTFAYSGHKGRPMHNPENKPTLHTSKEEYFKSTGSTIDHFHEKLLLLKDRMNTAAAKKLAIGRHTYMENFLRRFDLEWEGKM